MKTKIQVKTFSEHNSEDNSVECKAFVKTLKKEEFLSEKSYSSNGEKIYIVTYETHH